MNDRRNEPMSLSDGVAFGKARLSPRFALCVIVLLALGLNLGYVLTHSPRVHDEYLEIARHVLAGHGYALSIAGAPEPTNFRTPLYPLLIIFMLSVARGSLQAVTIAQACLGAATCVPVFLLGRRFFGDRAGLLAAMLTALDFPMMVMSGWILTERLYVFLILLAIYLAAGSGFRTQWRAAGMGIVFGLAILTRSESWVFLLLLLLTGTLLSPDRSRSVKNGMIAAVLALACVAPWLWRNHRILNSWAVSDPIFIDYNLYRGAADIRNDHTQFGFEFYRALRAGHSPFDSGRRFDAPGERHRIRQKVLSQWESLISERPDIVIKKRLKNLGQLWIYRGEFFLDESISLAEAIRLRRVGNLFFKIAFYFPFSLLPMMLAGAGTWMTVRKREWRASLMLWLYPAIITAMMVPLWADSRYNLPSHAALAPFVALALIQIFASRDSCIPRQSN